MVEVVAISAREVLDSRGRPTLAVHVRLAGGALGSAGVASGASTGSREAVELRDGDPGRYGGLGVRDACDHVMGEIAHLLRGRAFADLAELDASLVRLDGTRTKKRLGANALVGVSMAVARAMAVAEGAPLWHSLGIDEVAPRLPVPHFNVVNGGLHAPNELEFQEFMIAPLGAPSFAEALRAGAEVYSALRGELANRKLSTGLGDEGGFAPELSSPEQVLELIVAAISAAGYRPDTTGVAIALDPAATTFQSPDGSYVLEGTKLTSDELIDRYAELVERFPIWSIEDGLAEGDWSGWERLNARLGGRIQLVGDDIFVTNPEIITGGIERKVANAVLIKPNQIGTVTEALEAIRVARQGGWTQMVSHRSGETTDDFIADLAVASGCGQIKSGAPARGERVAKYNRLVEIEACAFLPYGRPS